MPIIFNCEFISLFLDIIPNIKLIYDNINYKYFIESFGGIHYKNNIVDYFYVFKFYFLSFSQGEKIQQIYSLHILF